MAIIRTLCAVVVVSAGMAQAADVHPIVFGDRSFPIEPRAGLIHGAARLDMGDDAGVFFMVAN
ncbi:MAG: hypothetical protein GY851_12115, partial [bacterium]|nr:hypothetical protein [bacterium]